MGSFFSSLFGGATPTPTPTVTVTPATTVTTAPWTTAPAVAQTTAPALTAPSVTFWSSPNGTGQSRTFSHVSELPPNTFPAQSASVQNGGSFTIKVSYTDGSYDSIGMAAGQAGIVNFPPNAASGKTPTQLMITVNGEIHVQNFASAPVAGVSPAVTFWSQANATGQSYTAYSIADMQKAFSAFQPVSATSQNGGSFSCSAIMADGTSISFGVSAGQTGSVNFPLPNQAVLHTTLMFNGQTLVLR